MLADLQLLNILLTMKIKLFSMKKWQFLQRPNKKLTFKSVIGVIIVGDRRYLSESRLTERKSGQQSIIRSLLYLWYIPNERSLMEIIDSP